MRKALILSAVVFAIGCGGSSSSSTSGSTGTTAGTTTGTGTTTGGTGTTTGGNGGNTNGSTGASPMTLSGVVSATSQSSPTASASSVGASQTQVNLTGLFPNGGTSQVIGELNTGSITQKTYTNSDFTQFNASILVNGTQLSAAGDPSDTYSLTITSVTTANGVSVIHGNGTFSVAVTGTYTDGGAASGTETISTGF